MYLALADESYPAEIAVGLGANKLSVQRIIADLEQLGVVASRLRGRVRLVTLNRTWYAAGELRSLLRRMAALNERITRAVASVRRRPRRSGKPP